MTPNVHRVLELRSALSQAATSKYTALLNHQHEGRIHDAFVFSGAGRTGRWSGRALQPQNMKRAPQGHSSIALADSICEGSFDAVYGGENALELLGGAIRSAIAAGKGKTLVVSDLASIESRVAGWISGDENLLEVFRKGLDPYKAFGSVWLEMPYDEITGGQRNLSKPPTLGCGYGMHWKGLTAYAKQYGVELSREQALSAVLAFRKTYPRIPEMWKWLGMAFGQAIVGVRTEGYRLVIQREGEMVTVQLPSGRKLYYHRPSITSDGMTYWGFDSYTHKWAQLRTHGAKIFENVCQAIAMDKLAHAMALAEDAGLAGVLHLHDELGCEVSAEPAKEASKTLHRCLITAPSWAPDLPLGAEGYISKRFKKG